MKLIDYDDGMNIIESAMMNLIDVDSGNFERLLTAVKEVLSLKREFLHGDAVKIFFDIDGIFDKNNHDEKQDYVWKNIAAMEDEKKQELAVKIFKLYKALCQAPIKDPDMFK